MKISLNQSTKFILPIISTDTMRSNFFDNKFFIGCYIGDLNQAKYQDKILLAYKFDMSINFVSFERKLMKNPYILHNADYDYDKHNIVVYVFNVPKEHLEDYYSIIEGRYSEVSNMLKLKILKFWGEKDTSLLHSILFKTEQIKKFWQKRGKEPNIYCSGGEYWYTPRIENELLDIENIK